jgi:RNA polymerase sigma-70 factor, ECF subfamily
LDDSDDGTTGITDLLIAWSGGRREALDNLLPLVYKDLRRLAAGYMKGKPVGHSLQPTALVHEAYVRLIDQRQVNGAIGRIFWRRRRHDPSDSG